MKKNQLVLLVYLIIIDGAVEFYECPLNCQGKSSNFMRKLLFSKGKPDAVEKYLEQLDFRNQKR